MKITIEISDNLFKNDASTKFQDFFERVIADMADSLNTDSPKLCGRYELETATLLQRAFCTAKYEIDGGTDNGRQI